MSATEKYLPVYQDVDGNEVVIGGDDVMFDTPEEAEELGKEGQIDIMPFVRVMRIAKGEPVRYIPFVIPAGDMLVPCAYVGGPILNAAVADGL